MIIRMSFIGNGTIGSPFTIDLPSFSGVVTNETTGRAFVTVPDVDVPTDVAAFVAAYPTVDLTTPLPVPFPQALARTWAEHLARRYDLGNVRWKPEIV